jgi:hypothetical protein
LDKMKRRGDKLHRWWFMDDEIVWELLRRLLNG